MAGDKGGIEQVLYRLLDYGARHDVDKDSLLIMLGLVNLMGLVNVLNRHGAGSSSTGNNMQSLLTPLIALAAAGMGGPGKAGQFNPAALLSLLGGMQGSGQGDLAGLLGLLGPLMGMGARGWEPGKTAGEINQSKGKNAPVQREINLDQKKNHQSQSNKGHAKKEDAAREKEKGSGKEIRPGAGEILEWKFGT